MEMKKINAGKLRAIGYNAKERVLRVEMDDGTAIDYSGVGNETWRRFSTASSSAIWSFYRDNIEEEFHGTRGRATGSANPSREDLDALFGTPDMAANKATDN